MKNLLALFFSVATLLAHAQYGPGIGIYPTGTEAGLGFRSGRDTRLALDIRLTRASLFNTPQPGSFVTECNFIFRAVHLEKVRFHIGLGYRADWNLRTEHKQGIVMPVGVEAFPFSFQNAGLFFESAPFGVFDTHNNYHLGIRTVAGFVFYFPKKSEAKPENKI